MSTPNASVSLEADWKVELGYLANMGFSDLNILLPLLRAHMKPNTSGQIRPLTALEPIILELIGSV